MKYLVALALLILSQQSLAQSFRDTRIPYQSDCLSMSFCVDCGEVKASFKGNLRKYLLSYVKQQKLTNKLSGYVQFNVIVDSLGVHCLKGIFNGTNQSHEQVLRTGLDTVIKNMQPWQPAIKEGQPKNSSITIMLYFNYPDKRRFDAEHFRVGKLMLKNPAK